MSRELSRWTYTEGSRPEGVVAFEDGRVHSFHDSDPAHGNNTVFDLVRLHQFGWMDTEADKLLPITERPSYKSMAALANEQPEVRIERAQSDFEVLEDEATIPTGSPGAEGSQSTVVSEVVPKATTRCTDLANANRLQKAYGANIFSCAKQFYFWTGAYWKPDDEEVFRCASKLSRLIRAEADALQARLDANVQAGRIVNDSDDHKKEAGYIKALRNWGYRSEGLHTITAALTILRTLLNKDPSTLNANPWLFNCRNGTVDLRTGVLQPHAASDFITICAPTVFDPAAKAPRFTRFLEEIFPRGPEMVAFVQRWFGYCITGSVREQKLVIHVGPGGNGKGTLMEVITHVVGEYASTAAPGLILAGSGAGDRHPTELADLLGRRMVTVTETDNEAQLREGLVKQATGGDRIKARKMHQDFMEFAPTHKLQVFTNHEPNIRGQDYGMWRRLLLVTYPVRFGPIEDLEAKKADRLRDTTLSLDLLAEARGVLAWLVDGARQWYTTGLQPPEGVLRAVDDYRFEQDRIAQFVAERCKEGSDLRVPLSRIFRAYTTWVTEVGYKPMGRGRFLKEIVRVAIGTNSAAWEETHGEVTQRVLGIVGLDLTTGGYE